MMTNAKVNDYLTAEPFRPFRIKMASGQTFEVRHPETLLVGRSSVRFYINLDDDPDKPAKWHDVSMMSMETPEPLDVTSNANAN